MPVEQMDVNSSGELVASIGGLIYWRKSCFQDSKDNFGNHIFQTSVLTVCSCAMFGSVVPFAGRLTECVHFFLSALADFRNEEIPFILPLD
jgi:hypothetical protein